MSRGARYAERCLSAANSAKETAMFMLTRCPPFAPSPPVVTPMLRKIPPLPSGMGSALSDLVIAPCLLVPIPGSWKKFTPRPKCSDSVSSTSSNGESMMVCFCAQSYCRGPTAGAISSNTPPSRFFARLPSGLTSNVGLITWNLAAALLLYTA